VRPEALAIRASTPAETPSLGRWDGNAPLAVLASGQPEVLTSGKKWLERYGFKVAVASTLLQAAALLENASAELAVADSSLRGPEGLGAWAALRAMPGGTERLLLALCATDVETRSALLDGATDVVRKPLDWQLLSQRAVRLVQGQRTARELAGTRRELELLRRPGTDAQGDPSASLDGLTGLPQRRAFERMLEGALAGSLRTGTPLAVVFLDLDRFKLTNGTYGRLGGSQVLVQVADRLRGCLRKRELLGPRRVGVATAAIARVGGDAFSLMVSPVGGRDDVAPIAQAVLDALSRPCAVGNDEVYVSASLGIAVAPEDGKTAEELLQRAEMAMAEAGRRGGGAYRFYSRSLVDARERALKMDRLLRRTLDREELSLLYQPIVQVRTRQIAGVEVLLRWTSPELGMVPPTEFIPAAEETGFMVDIGKWTLRSACRQLKAWVAEGLPRIRVATNVSLCQLVRGNLPQIVDEALAEAGLDPSLLELELSERGVLRSDPDILRQLHALRRRGVRISVDDFGTGDSAIAYLKRFPLDTLKVDQSFVAGALTNPDDAAITSAMIAMAHRLRLRVVAEGVERQEQFDLLEQMECEEVQGYFFAPPVPAEKFRSLLARSDRG
jgi:diguanylate cyclase (GGDEF)-like protein